MDVNLEMNQFEMYRWNRETSPDVQIELRTFGIYSKSCVRERGHPLDSCMDDLGPGPSSSHSYYSSVLPATMSLMFHAASFGVFEIQCHCDAPPLEDTDDGELREAWLNQCCLDSL